MLHSWSITSGFRKRRHSCAMFSIWFIAAHNLFYSYDKWISERRNTTSMHLYRFECRLIVWSGWNGIKTFNLLSFDICRCYKRILMFHSMDCEFASENCWKTPLKWFTEQMSWNFCLVSHQCDRFNQLICYFTMNTNGNHNKTTNQTEQLSMITNSI